MKRFFNFITLSEAAVFNFHPKNRMIDRKHLQKIKKLMRESVEKMPAIIINTSTLHVIDGQHRLEALRQLASEGEIPWDTRIPVDYMDIPEENEYQEIVKYNINSQNWKPYDFIHAHMKEGNPNYLKLDEWARNHTLTANLKDPSKPKYRYAGIMMKGSTLRNELPNGTFEVTDEELAKADTIHGEVEKLITLFGLPIGGQWFEQMLCSWFKFRELHKFSEWTRYIRDHRKGLRKYPKATVADWNAVFSMIHSQLDLKSAA